MTGGGASMQDICTKRELKKKTEYVGHRKCTEWNNLT